MPSFKKLDYHNISTIKPYKQYFFIQIVAAWCEEQIASLVLIYIAKRGYKAYGAYA